MNDKVRARFAPSPTGYLHVGVARTALFTWLFARHNNGKFILRIDDTDKARSKEEYRKDIVESMRWLGMLWDEGPEVGGPYSPYIQSERMDLYRKYTQELLESGNAYHCYCTVEEIDEQREKAEAEGRSYRYEGRCQELTDEKRKQYEAEGRKPTVRLKVERAAGSLKTDENPVIFHDLVIGDVRFEADAHDDFIIVTSDGRPLYNFSSVIDDYLMEISHVIRASDHISNTPKQILIYRALGWEPPKFAHVPMVLGSSKGEKLSKRRGAISISQYRSDGYLPSAMINFMARLGWSYDDTEEFFSVDELIEKFDISRVSRSGSVFDMQKLNWLNSKYIVKLSLSERIDAVIPFLEKEGLCEALEEFEGEMDDEKREWLEKLVEAVGDRMTTLADIVELTRDFFVDEYEYEKKAVKKWLRKDYAPELLKEMKELFAEVEPFDEDELENALRKFIEQSELNVIKVLQPIRVAVTGKSVGLGIFETLALFGKEKVLERLDRTLKRITNYELRIY